MLLFLRGGGVGFRWVGPKQDDNKERVGLTLKYSRYGPLSHSPPSLFFLSLKYDTYATTEYTFFVDEGGGHRRDKMRKEKRYF